MSEAKESKDEVASGLDETTLAAAACGTCIMIIQGGGDEVSTKRMPMEIGG